MRTEIKRMDVEAAKKDFVCDGSVRLEPEDRLAAVRPHHDASDRTEVERADVARLDGETQPLVCIAQLRERRAFLFQQADRPRRRRIRAAPAHGPPRRCCLGSGTVVRRSRFVAKRHQIRTRG